MRPTRILIVSDATGETAERVARSALTQFAGAELPIQRLPRVRTIADVTQVVRQVLSEPSLVVYTLVDPELRARLQSDLAASDVVAIDILGPVLAQMAAALDADPLTVPGLQHRQDALYGRRMAAIEYAVKHDDGVGFSTLRQADIVLVGPSRTGKTPLSIFLANAGWFVANVPFISDRTMPAELPEDIPGLVVGLRTTPETLLKAREEHLFRLGSQQQQSRYAEAAVVQDELEAAVRYFKARAWPIVDVTGKAIEEIAVEILEHVEDRRSAGTGEGT